MMNPQDEERLARRVSGRPMRRTSNDAYGPDFFQRWPNLWRAMWEERPTCPLSERGGIECGPAWRPILEVLSEKLEALILALPEADRPLHHAVQCKEKFFGLALHMRRTTAEMAEAISLAEAACALVCDACGEVRDRPGPCTRTT